jgi:hypothetical protein
VAERRGKKTAAPEDMIVSVQNVIDDVCEKNDFIGDFDRELFMRSRRDGEWFLAIYPEADGISCLRIVEPEQITEPKNARDLEDHYGIVEPSNWLFGIHTDGQDTQRVHGYHAIWNSQGSDFDYFSTREMQHHKVNVDRGVKRGISDYFPVYKKLQRLGELQQNTAATKLYGA